MKVLQWLATVAFMLGGCEPLIYRAQEDAPAEPGKLAPARPLLEKVATDRPAAPVKGIFNGEPVLVDYNSGDGGTCASMLVTYQHLDYSETWDVCADGAAIRAADETKALPKGDDFRTIRHAVSQGAWKFGQAQAVYAGYEIFASGVGNVDDERCLTVENVVVQNQRTVDTRHEKICGER